jgi:kynurenine formamidase
MIEFGAVEEGKANFSIPLPAKFSGTDGSVR